jgi:phosphatidate cytidylyltransferase
MTAYGALYVGLLMFIALLKRDQGARGGGWVFLLLTVTWFGDTFAYAAGRLAGRHKLYPRISPGKTWEGAVGGLVGSFAAAALAHAWYLPELSWAGAAGVALPAGALGQVGDLCESLLKRAYGVKDSGALLPGHGGLLDRIDALLFAAPYVYYCARWLP